MSGTTLLEDLTRHGVKLWAEGGELRCRGPKKALTPEVLAELKSHKPEILSQLNPPSTAGTSPRTVSEVVRCIHNTTPNECALCSGYVRWLNADEHRIERALHNPDKVRRDFWREVKGDAS